jgi:hypothetical protein
VSLGCVAKIVAEARLKISDSSFAVRRAEAEKTRNIHLLMRPERTVKSVEERQEDDEKGEEVHDDGWV